MDIYEAALCRRTVRRFRSEPVYTEDLVRCINAARVIPSAANLQPLEYIIVDDEQLLPQVYSTLKWAVYISPEGDPPEGHRPTAYIVILKQKDTGVPSSAYDIGAAMEVMILVAFEQDIAACPIASVDRDKLSEILGIPDSYEIPLVLAMGYPDEKPVEVPFDGSVKYWKDENGTLHVPKKKLGMILHRNGY